MADLLEIQGANAFRVRAYRNARSSLEALTDSIEEIAKRDALNDISGIGKDLAAKIIEYIRTERIQAFEGLKQELPIGLVSILSVPTIGPKTARAIFDHTGVSSVEELEKLAGSEELLTVPGIKQLTLENIVRGIGLYKRRKGLFLLGRALPVAKDMCEMLSPMAEQVTYAGSLRRMRETVHDIDILAASSNPQKVMKEFVSLPMVERVLVSGYTKTSVLIANDLQVDLRVVGLDSWGAALAYFTGSKKHNIRLRERAIKRGLKLNEYGLYDSADTSVAGREEEDIYHALDLPWIPPVLREDRGEIEAALGGGLPELVSSDDIQGDLHMHTTWSDGALSTEAMVEAARRQGYTYVAITDHSKSLGVAGGLSSEDLLRHAQEIHAMNRKRTDCRVLAGTEVDIRADGTLDYSDEILAQLDFVVASVHSGFRQDKETMTPAGRSRDSESACPGDRPSHRTLDWRPRFIRTGFRSGHGGSGPQWYLFGGQRSLLPFGLERRTLQESSGIRRSCRDQYGLPQRRKSSESSIWCCNGAKGRSVGLQGSPCRGIVYGSLSTSVTCVKRTQASKFVR